MNNQQVAQIILQQLGGGRFTTMTGAKNLAAHSDALSFRLPSNFAKNKINWVKITLDESDTYVVVFGSIRGSTFKEVSKHDTIYCNMLQKLFTAETGLDTHL